ncbi:MAG: leucine-rich repeat domain-containing protein, partial [Clostridia bacterium]|nr:leucine-rich repeat domain-containing protein [Clostridia bacterium]
LTAVPDMTDCEKLTAINLNNNAITDISKIDTGKALTTVDLSGNAITDVSALEKATTITSLNLANNKITDIKAIGKLTDLKSLDLSGNADLESIEALNDFPTTTSLDLNIVGTKAANDVEAIEELQKKFSTMKITYVEKKEDK